MEKYLKLRTREYLPFTIMLGVNLTLMISAFVVAQPSEVLSGFTLIITSPSILATDYIELGGLGGALMNVSIVGFATLFMLLQTGVKPYGANIMALWMSLGFAFFGKNVFNMIPLTFGVWLFSKYSKEPFSKYYLSALLVATLSPTVSEVAFMGALPWPIEIALGVLLGFAIGFIFPAVSAGVAKSHGGFNLYSMGFAGGLIATLLTTMFRNLGIEITPASLWSTGNNLVFAILLYFFSGAMLLTGVLTGLKSNLSGFLKIQGHSGELVSDYYELYHNSIYINMAALCASATTLVLLMNGEFSGPVLAGVLTMTGFGALGKHMKNVTPVIFGAILSALANGWDLSNSRYLMPALFSSGLAPIAGKFGWPWGIVAGFLHVNVAVFVGDINGGMNLYNNGFAANFIAMFVVPVASIFKSEFTFKRDKYKK